MKVILYGSEYGTAKQYADALGRMTGTEVLNYADVKNMNLYDTIVYIGALYAGGVLGMKKTFEKLQNVDDKKIVIATVGLADPEDPDNIESIRRNMQKQLSADVWNHAEIHHLRGGIDYSRLNFKHKTMMALLYQKAKNLPEEKKTADARAMVETYNSKVNFVDETKLQPIAVHL